MVPFHDAAELIGKRALYGIHAVGACRKVSHNNSIGRHDGVEILLGNGVDHKVDRDILKPLVPQSDLEPHVHARSILVLRLDGSHSRK